MSSPAQITGDSQRRQLEASRRYAEKEGLEFDEGSEMEDLGRSAFHGAHVSKDGALGKFLSRVERGEIPRGSCLIVESLDRLSRQEPLSALGQLQKLVENGVSVVSLSEGKTFDNLNDFTQLILSVVTMYRAYQESRTKKKHLDGVWDEKRRNAHTKKMTRVCPAWLTPNDDCTEFTPNKLRSRVVQQIFEDAASGIGVYRIVQRLNASKTPTFGRSEHWQHSTVKKILANPAVRGHLQPHQTVKKLDERTGAFVRKRDPVGDLIEHYYPRIIDDALFYRAQNGLASRRTTRDGHIQPIGGRTGKATTNLFRGLLFCAACGGRVVYLNKGAGPKGGSYVACSRAVRQGIGCTKRKMRYWEFEAAVLRHARLALTSALRGEDSRTKHVEDELIVAKAKLTEAEKKGKYLDQLALAADELDTDTLEERRDVEAAKIALKKEIKRLHFELDAAIHAHDITHDLDEVIEALRQQDSPNLVRDRANAAQLMSQIIKRIDIGFGGLEPFSENAWQSRLDAEIEEDEWEALISPADEASGAPAFALTYHGDSGGDLIQTWRSDPQSLRFHCPLRPEGWENIDPKYYRPSAEIGGKMTVLNSTATINLHR